MPPPELFNPAPSHGGVVRATYTLENPGDNTSSQGQIVVLEDERSDVPLYDREDGSWREGGCNKLPVLGFLLSRDREIVQNVLLQSGVFICINL